MKNVLSRLRSYFIFVPLIFFYTFVLGAISLVCSLRDKDGRLQHRCARLWSWVILKTIHSPVLTEGLEHISSDTAQVFAVNHTSAMDIPLLYTQLPVQFRIVANRNLFDYPFMGWHLRRSGQIAIDRTSMRSTVKSFLSAVDDLKQQMNVLIFPEGGRSADGRMQPFFAGAFHLAIRAQAPVVPIAVVGAFEMLPMDTFHIMPRKIELRVGAPIPTAGLTASDLEALSLQVREAIETLYGSR